RRASLKAPWSISSSTQWVASVGRPDAFDVAGEAGKPDLVRRNPIAHLDQPIRALSNESQAIQTIQQNSLQQNTRKVRNLWVIESLHDRLRPLVERRCRQRRSGLTALPA